VNDDLRARREDAESLQLQSVGTLLSAARIAASILERHVLYEEGISEIDLPRLLGEVGCEEPSGSFERCRFGPAPGPPKKAQRSQQGGK